MTAKRDESRDVLLRNDSITISRCKWSNRDYIGQTRYVPHSQYAALEAENASLSKSLTSVSEMLDKQAENMLALREFVQRIAEDDFDEFGSNLIYEARGLIAKVTR